MARTTLKVFEDASALVRYEGIIVLAQMLEKYFPAFLAASEEMTGITEEANSEDDRSGPTNEVEAIDRKFPFPGSIDNETADKFRAIWKSLRDVQHRDAHSSVASAANSMVRYVHENILRAQSIIRSEENKSPLLDGSMSTSEHDLLRLSASTNEKPPDGPVTGSVSVINPRSGVDGDDHMPLRRISSEFGVSMRRLLPDAASRGLTAKKEDEGSILTYALPTSEFFEWKRATFFSKRSFLAFYDDMDPLSPQGALKSYLWRRNSAAENKCRKLEKDFSCLAPIPPKPQRDSLNEVLLLEEEEASPNPLENEMTERKKALHFKEIGLYRNVGVDSISLLNFHPYEDILVVCDGRSGITAWDSNRGTKELEFQNGNPRGSRFTSACWMNEAYNSLLVTGCDDGSVRVWGGLAFSAAEGRRQASKVSAFFAVPNLTPDTSKSGLILEWQQSSGLLNAAGNSDKIRSWDMNVEKCCHEMKTETKACITTLTTPWRDYLFEDARAMSGSYGAGPNLLVAGFSDGSIRLFDNRMGSPVMDASANSSRGRKQRMMHYKEHGSWVVTTAFTGYGNQYQVSNCK
jgi:regulator-associated protein of mTOR